MHRTLILTGLLGLIVAQPSTAWASGKGGRSTAPSGYRPALVFPNGQQPKFINPIGNNNLVNPKFGPNTGTPVGGMKLGNTSGYNLKGSSVTSGTNAYKRHHGYRWFTRHCHWPSWCDFSDFGYPGMDDDDDSDPTTPDSDTDSDSDSEPDKAGPAQGSGPATSTAQPMAPASPGTQQPTPAATVQVERFIRVKNDTKEKVRFFALFHALTPDGKAEWVPAEPADPATLYTVEVEPGKALELTDDDGRPISADRVRIWAASRSRRWLDNKDADLWLVPETDGAGNHRYEAPQKETHTFTVTD
jgi:hypothetical protein